MTRDEIISVLTPLRLRGNHLIVHASLSAFGSVEGGARAVCEALIQSVSESGTILVPTFTYDTMVGDGPPHPRSVYHIDMPVHREIGAIAEAFRKLPKVTRSNHPTHSFAARGRLAREVLSTQRDNNPLGPLKKLNLLQGHVLLLGTRLLSATAIHLAEERAEMPYLTRRTALRINATGNEERVVLEKVPGCSFAFDRLEAQLDPSKFASVPLARGEARKLPVRYLLGLATEALEKDAHAFVCERPDCHSCEAKRQALAAASRNAS